MTRSKVNFKVTSRLKLEIQPFLTAISSAIYNGSWQLTTDSYTRAQYLNFYRAGFLIFVLVFVSCDFELGRKVTAESQPLVPHRANLLCNGPYSGMNFTM